MTHVPYRTGLPTIIKSLKVICNLIVRYKDIMQAVLPPDQFVYVQALEQACNDFILNVSNPRPYDPE